MDTSTPDASGLVPPPDDFANASPPDASVPAPAPAGILPAGTTLHAPDPGTGVTHVKGPTGAVVPVATSFLTPADHQMLGTPQAPMPEMRSDTRFVPRREARSDTRFVPPDVLSGARKSPDRPVDMDSFRDAAPAPKPMTEAEFNAPIPSGTPVYGDAGDPQVNQGKPAPEAPKPALPGGSDQPVDSRPYAAEVAAASAKYPAATPEVLHGLLDVESRHGTSGDLSEPGPAGTGDGGHGHGLTQIDDRYHQDFLDKKDENGTPLWQKPKENIEEGARIYQEAYDAATKAGVPEKDRRRVAADIYNHGADTALAAYKKGVPLAYGQMVENSIAKGGGDTKVDASASSTNAAGASDEVNAARLDAAKSRPKTALGQLISSDIDTKTQKQTLTMLGSDGAIHKYDLNMLRQKAPALADHIETVSGLKSAQPTGVMDAIKSGVGAAPNVAADAAHPVISELASGAKSVANFALATNPVTAPYMQAKSAYDAVAGGGSTAKSDAAAAADAEIKQVQPAVQPATAQAPAAAPGASATGTPAPAADPDAARFDRYSKDLDNAFDAQKAANGQLSTAEQAQSDAIGKTMGDAADASLKNDQALGGAYSKLGDAYKQRFQATLAADHDLYKQAAVNPNSLWSNASTGRKVLGGIGLMFSNIGATYLGATPVDLISKAIDHDIQIQQDSFRNRQRAGAAVDSAYGQLVQGGLSEVEAAHVMKMVGLETAKLKINAIAQQTNSPVIAAKAEQASADIDKQTVAQQANMIGAYDEHRIRSEQAKRLEIGNQQAQNPGAPAINDQNRFSVKGRDFALPGAKVDPDAKALPAEAAAYETVSADLDHIKSSNKEWFSSFKASSPGADIQGKKMAILEKIQASAGGKDDPVSRALIAQANELLDPKTFQTEAAYDRGVDALKSSLARALDERFKNKGLPAYSTIQAPSDAQVKSATSAGNFTPVGK